jgi:hypothetical protein
LSSVIDAFFTASDIAMVRVNGGSRGFPIIHLQHCAAAFRYLHRHRLETRNG